MIYAVHTVIAIPLRMPKKGLRVVCGEAVLIGKPRPGAAEKAAIAEHRGEFGPGSSRDFGSGGGGEGAKAHPRDKFTRTVILPVERDALFHQNRAVQQTLK